MNIEENENILNLNLNENLFTNISFEKYVEKAARIISKSIINFPPTFVSPPHSYKDFKVHKKKLKVIKLIEFRNCSFMAWLYPSYSNAMSTFI